MGGPFVEIAGRVEESTKAHIGVLDPAKFRALTPVFTRDVRIQRYLIDLAGDDVALSANRRHEEAVNDVLRNELEVDYPVRRNMYLVGGGHAQAGVLEFPPPLMSDNPDRQRLLRPPVGLSVHDSPHCWHRDRDQDQRGDDRPRHLEPHVGMLHRWRSRLARTA